MKKIITWWRQLKCKHTFTLVDHINTYPISRDYDVVMCGKCRKHLGIISSIECQKASGMIFKGEQIIGCSN